MTRKARGLIVGVLTLAVFLGVGYYDANQRAYRLQDGAHMTLDACESMAEQAGRPADPCITEFRAALDASQGLALKAALPMALGAAALFLVLALGTLRVLRSRKADAADAGGSV
jgi:hypothetical protein